jgi:hypothetical protein
MKSAHNSCLGTADDAHNASFRAAVAYCARFNHDAIAVHGCADGNRWYEDVAPEALSDLFSVRNDEPVTIAVHGKAARNQISTTGLGHRITIAGHFHQFATRDQLLQTFPQFPPFVAVESQLANELFVPGYYPRLQIDSIQNGAVGKHRSSWPSWRRRLASAA